MSKYFLFILCCSFHAVAHPLQITARQIGPTEKEQQNIIEKILTHPNVAVVLENKKYRVLTFELREKRNSSQVDYMAYIYNYTNEKMWYVHGPINFRRSPQVELAFDDIPATPEEFSEAIEILKTHPDFAIALTNKDLIPYESMPTTVVALEFMRGFGGPRIIGVGLSSPQNPERHEIVGVNLNTAEIKRFTTKAPPTSLATEITCGFNNARQSVTGKGRAGSAQIEINDGDETLWNFIVVRPSASSGRKGSGLELRNVYYKGALVLTRIHIPILNVQYADNRCGPYRDWAYAENYFSAVGEDKAPGIRIATQPPKTISDTGNDFGNFRGVAIYQDQEKVTLVTEISAGWYRYASKYELYNDGTIKPYFQFSAVENSCVCYSHNHHVYWRFDFDIDGTANSVAVSNGESVNWLEYETVQTKSDTNKFWLISNADFSKLYRVSPGKDDGYADNYSIADTWLLRYHSSEIDDSRVKSSTRAALGKFVTNENINESNLVMWYSAHYIHSHDDRSDSEASVGPVLTRISE